MVGTLRIRLCVVALLTLIAFSSVALASLNGLHPSYCVVNEFEIPAGLTRPLGDILFSADGATAYILDNSEETNSAVWSLPVTRNAAGHVTGFGTATLAFMDSTMDTGLEYAPNGTTLFYRTNNNITQRLPNGTTEDKAIVTYDGGYGGLAVVPPGYSNAGNIVVASYDEDTLHLHAVTDDGDGTYTIANGTLYADLSSLSGGIGDGYPGDLHFITSGPLAGSLLVAGYYNDELSLFRIPLDPVTGLPQEGTSPTLEVVATGADNVWGLAVDPVTDNIWYVEWYNESVLPPGTIQMVQIAEGIVVVHPDYSLFNTFQVPAGLTQPLGDLAFSSDGATAFILDRSEEATSAVWSLPVTRDSDGSVIGLGAASQLFTDSDMDTGLELAPNGTTFVYRTANNITQRLPNGTTEDKTIVNYDGSSGGMAFFPGDYSSAGHIVSASHTDGSLHFHAVTDDGDGTYSIADGTAYADLSSSLGTSTIGDVAFLSSGPAADSLLVATWDDLSYSFSTFPLDPVTGLPLEGSSPTPVAFATGTPIAWGVAVDPVSSNIWLVKWPESEVEGSADLLQIGRRPFFADGFESGTLTAWSNY